MTDREYLLPAWCTRLSQAGLWFPFARPPRIRVTITREGAPELFRPHVRYAHTRLGNIERFEAMEGTRGRVQAAVGKAGRISGSTGGAVVQYQTSHGRRRWWVNLVAGWGGVSAVLSVLIGIDAGPEAGLQSFAALLILAAPVACWIPFGRNRSGLFDSGQVFWSRGTFARRSGRNTSESEAGVVGTVEEDPGVWLTVQDGGGRPRRTTTLIHIPQHALLGFFFRTSNELLRRSVDSAHADERSWHSTGLVWRDDGDAEFARAVTEVLGVQCQAPADEVTQRVARGDFPAFATSLAMRPRLPWLPTLVVPLPALAVLPAVLATPLWTPAALFAPFGAGLALLFQSRLGQRELIIEPGQLVVVGLWSSRRLHREHPVFDVQTKGLRSYVFEVSVEPPVRVTALSGHRKVVGNDLMIRYARSGPDEAWRPTGHSWGDNGRDITDYLTQLASQRPDHGRLPPGERPPRNAP